jgi:uncharacterized SAM-binding protein YcdF (DUF218 family)
MYFLLSKILGFFAVPSNLIAISALSGLIFHIFRRPIGKPLTIFTLVALLIAGLSPLGTMLLTPLEQRFPGMKFPERIDGIIILGGSYDTQSRGYISTIILNEDTDRLAVVAALAQRYSEAKIVFSGGSNSFMDDPDPRRSEAEVAKRLFVSFGIDVKRIVIEDRSRNTEENAKFTEQLIKPSASSIWLLVTSAYHLPRAAGTFRKNGFTVIGFPVGWRTHGWRDFFWPALTVTENLRRVDIATREWIGLTLYRILGYSDTWYPRP